MRKIDRRIIVVASVVFIMTLAYGIMRFLAAQRPGPPTRRSMEARRVVKMEAIAYQSLPSQVKEGGRLASTAEVEIIAEASGKIQPGSVSLKKGAGFKKGDVLFVVYPDEAILSLKARKSQYQNTLAGMLPDLSIDFKNEAASYRDFFSSIDVNKALPPLPETSNEQLRIFLASREVISEYYNIQRDELQVERRTVRAPFSGTFKEVYMEPGAYTNAGGRIARAIRTDQLELEVPLPRVDAAWVNIGDPVEVTNMDGIHVQGRVIRKSRFIDENTQSQEIYISLNNQSAAPLLAGEYLEASFPVHPIEGVMEIPRNAVFNSNEVFLVRAGRLQKAQIEIVKENQRTLLFRGLPEGDTIVLQQLINVSEGTLVEPSQPDHRNKNQGPEQEQNDTGGEQTGPGPKQKEKEPKQARTERSQGRGRAESPEARKNKAQ
ncbi:MAG: hypothetical protein CSA96_01520 [Bacteroidetes bacterium]|nr:MAG: hypothetical protein CSA96_01520 [Bacteroidota bacterium]